VIEPVKIGDVTLYHADCRDVLPMLGKVDAVVTDPPYNWGKDIQNDDMGWDAYWEWLEGIWRMVADAMNDGFLIADIPRTKLFEHHACLAKSFQFYDYRAVFFKNSIANRGMGIDRFILKAVFRKGDIKVPKRKSNCTDEEIACYDSRKAGFTFLHPTQKSIRSYSYFIDMLAEKQSTILDPFMGSGTTGVACAKLGRKFIGIEISEPYFKIACERIDREYAQGKLFNK